MSKSKWKLILKKNSGPIIIDYFTSKKEADEEVKYRYDLCRHLGYPADLTYEVIEVPPHHKN